MYCNCFVFTIQQASKLFLPQGTVFGRNNNREVMVVQDCFMMMSSKVPNEKDFDAGFLYSKS